MVTRVNTICADATGLIANETWRITKAHCPRCGNPQTVWMLDSNRPAVVGNQELRLFLCIACNYTALGLGGFDPGFDPRSRSAQIVKYAFGEEAAV